MTEEGLYGYCAGFLDADGCINKNTKTGRWYVNVSNTVPEALELFVGVFGGSIHKHRDTGDVASIGIVSTKPIYRWYASGAVGMALCEAALPYLIVKRDKARQAINEKFGLKIWPPKPIDWAAVTERKRAAATKRAAIKERQRKAVELRKQGMSYREIMGELGYSGVAGAYGAVLAGSQTNSEQGNG